MKHEALKTKSAAWFRVHRAVAKKYGSAIMYECCGHECTEAAWEWAWIHGTDPNDIENYMPMCVSCHRKYDFTAKQRQRISEALTGRTFSEEHRDNLSEAATKSWRYRR